MSAGTIKLTNASNAVVGTSTTFTSDLKSGDVISTTISGVPYTLFVDTVTSNTALTLSDAFTGPTTTGAAYVAVPQMTLNRITAALAAQTAEAVRRLLQDNANLQAFYNGTGDITMTLPDGTPTGKQVSGPSWAKLSGVASSAWIDRGSVGTADNINTYNPATTEGEWYKSSSTGITTANGFPVGAYVGILKVVAGGRYNGTQVYTDYMGNQWARALTAVWNGTDGPWGDWYNTATKSLRSTVVTGSSTDLNTYTTADQYGTLRVASSTAATAAMGWPYDNFAGTVEVVQGYGSGAQQIALSTTGSMFSRYWNGGTSWSIWTEIGAQSRPGFVTGDLNTILDGGIYSVSYAAATSLNMPAPIGGILRVTLRGNSATTVVQEYIPVVGSGTYAGRKYFRTLAGGTWTAWNEDGIYPLQAWGVGGQLTPYANPFDWQADVVNLVAGQMLRANTLTQLNPPTEFSSTTSYGISIFCVASVSTTRKLLKVIMDTVTSVGKEYYVYAVGAAGSVVYTVRELYSSASTVPVASGGTGGTTQATARAGLGLKGAAVLDVGTAAGTVAAGDDARFNTLNLKTGGTISSGVAITAGDVYLNNGNLVSIFPVPAAPATGQYVNGGIIRTGYSGVYAAYYTDFYTQTVQGSFTQSVITLHASNIQSWIFNQSGNATAPGSWVSGSDERHKSNIVLVPNSLEAVLSWRGCTYDKKDGVSEVGLIAQDVEKSCPIAVFNTGRRTFSDNTVIEDFKSLNVAGASAAYHTEAIKELFSLVKLALDDPAAARAQIEEIEATLNAGKNQADTQP